MSDLHFANVMDYLKKRGYKVGDDPHQLEYVIALVNALTRCSGTTTVDGSQNAVFVNAPSGTGKTTLATLIGAYAVDRALMGRIIYVRSEVDVDDVRRGALPGDDDEKNRQYQTPFVEALDEHKPGTFEQWSNGLQKQPKAIATHPGHFRGITRRKSFVILDESQNTTSKQLLACYTRFTQDCVVVTIGHSGQCDLKHPQLIGGYLPFEVFAKHHAKRGAWVGKLVTNYRGDFAQWSDEVQTTIDELRR